MNKRRAGTDLKPSLLNGMHDGMNQREMERMRTRYFFTVTLFYFLKKALEREIYSPVTYVFVPLMFVCRVNK